MIVFCYNNLFSWGAEWQGGLAAGEASIACLRGGFVIQAAWETSEFPRITAWETSDFPQITAWETSDFRRITAWQTSDFPRIR